MAACHNSSAAQVTSCCEKNWHIRRIMNRIRVSLRLLQSLILRGNRISKIGLRNQAKVCGGLHKRPKLTCFDPQVRFARTLAVIRIVSTSCSPSRIAMMQTAEHGNRNDLALFRRINFTRERCIASERKMRSRFVIIGEVVRQNPLEM
jgi:hypothetical protein